MLAILFTGVSNKKVKITAMDSNTKTYTRTICLEGEEYKAWITDDYTYLHTKKYRNNLWGLGILPLTNYHLILKREYNKKKVK